MRFNGNLRMKFGSIPALSISKQSLRITTIFLDTSTRLLTSFSKHHKIYLDSIYWCECNTFAGACPVWKAGHTYTSPTPSQTTGLFINEIT